MSFRLRGACAADASEISRLCGELGYAADPEAAAGRLALMLADPRYAIFVAEEDERTLLGWIAVERRLTLETGLGAEITGLVVSAATRRHGVGRALVSAAETWATHAGLSPMRVRSNIARLESHPFYEGLGFRRSKSQHVYVKPVEPLA